MPEVKLIAAIDDNYGIAKTGKLPWNVPSDRKYFQDHIKQGPVVMGWKTFESNRFKAYGDGPNMVITRRNTEAVPGAWIVHDAVEFFNKNKADVWVVGGGQIFKQALPFATKLYVTRISGDYGCDVFFPNFEKDFKLISEQSVETENGIDFRYQIWSRK